MTIEDILVKLQELLVRVEALEQRVAEMDSDYCDECGVSRCPTCHGCECNDVVCPDCDQDATWPDGDQ